MRGAREKIDSRRKAYLAAQLALDKRGESLCILDMRAVCNFCDYFVILSASSMRRAQTIAENIQKGLFEKRIPIRAQEGLTDSQWILLDLFDVVVHIFCGSTREYYDLEKIWQDAPRLKFPIKKHGQRRKRRTTKSASSKSTS